MHVSNGDRTFLKDTDSHAEVVKSGFLGISSAVVMECDDGVMRAYCGEELDDKVVNTTTGKDGKGVDFDVPVDVRTIGPTVLTSLGVDTGNQTAIFQKFMVLPKAVRREKISLWNTQKDDVTERAGFLSDLMTLLGDDDLFIKTQSASLLKHIDDETRTGMLTKFYELTTSESRKDMIVQYTANKNDKFKTQEFLQGIYKMTLTDDQYMRIEFTRMGNMRNIDRLEERIDSYMTQRTDAYKERIARIWRSRKYYRSKTGPRFTWAVLRRL